METVTKINATEIKKELYKSKVNAKFSHYLEGNLYYNVELSDGIYQFPMLTTESGTLTTIDNLVSTKILQLETNREPRPIEIQNEIDALKRESERMTRLSSDLGITPFYAEVKAAELNRWIEKSIKKDTFIKIANI